MQKINTYIIGLGLVLTVAFASIPYKAQAQTADFLTTNLDPRSLALGNAAQAQTPDVFSQYSNIARYAFMSADPAKDSNAAHNALHSSFQDACSFASQEKDKIRLPFRFSAGASYMPWMPSVSSDMGLFSLAGAFLFKKQVISVSMRYFSMGAFTVTDKNNNDILTQTPHEFCVDLGYSRRLGEHFSMGVLARMVSVARFKTDMDYLSLNNVLGAAVDLGFYYQRPHINNEWALGASLQNIGSKMDLGGALMLQPMRINLGGRYSFHFGAFHELQILADISKSLVASDNADRSVVSSMFYSFSNSAKEITTSLGCEYMFLRTFKIRMGYYYNNPEYQDRSNLAFGVGGIYKGVGLDFSYLLGTGQHAGSAANTLVFSLHYSF